MGVLAVMVSGFAAGVFLRSVVFDGWQIIAFALLLAIVFGIAAFLNPRRAYTLGAVFFLMLALGGFRFALSETELPQAFANDLGKRVSYEAVVAGDPDLRDATMRVPLLVQKDGERTKILAVASRRYEAQAGDRVRVSGTLEIPEPFANDDGRIFRFDKYLEKDGVRFILNFSAIYVEQPASWYSLHAFFPRLKHAFINGVNSALPEPYSSLANGIVIGGKSGLGEELKEAFTRSGIVHMVVLSGHNVMVVASWVMAFFVYLFAKTESVFGMRVPRGASIGFGTLALIFFVSIAGFSATAIRATLMALIALYAQSTRRSYAASRALLFVIFLMLLWNPMYLAFDPGFGLSIAATTGLIWLAPRIEERLLFLKNPFWKNILSTTLAAQIFVLPLLLYNTGNLSLVSLPANLLAVPVVPFAMGFAYLAGFAGILFGGFAQLLGIAFAFPAYLTNSYLIFVAQASAELPLSAVTLPPFPFYITAAVYIGFIYAIARLNRASQTSQLMLAKKAST